MAVALRLESDMEADLRQAQRVSLEDWRRRPVSERAIEWIGCVFSSDSNDFILASFPHDYVQPAQVPRV